jgi:hypothetical protein
MELKFELATEPAVKAAIAIGAFTGITSIITNSPNAFGLSGCVLITGLALIIGTYKMPPLRTCTNYSSMSDNVSAESLRAQMPHATLTHIAGKPTHKQLKILEKELAANLMAIPCPWGHGKGHLGLLQDPTLYQQVNGAVFTIPDEAPPEYPVNAPAAAPARKAACATNLANRKAWNTYIIVRTITRNKFAVAIDDIYYAEMDDLTKGLNAISFL